MKKRTSKTSKIIKSVLVLPLIAFLLYGFSETKFVQVPNNSQEFANNSNSFFQIYVTQKESTLELLCKQCPWDKLSVDLEEKEVFKIGSKGLIESDNAYYPKRGNSFLFLLQKNSNKIELRGIEGTAWKSLSFSIYPNETRGFSNKGTIFVPNSEHIAFYNSFAKKYNAIPIAKRVIPIPELEKLEYIYNLMTHEQKANAEPYPFLRLQKYPQQNATREQMAEYNRLAKKYNDMPRDRMRISTKEVEKLTYLYSIMSDKQRADAEPFPDFPEPPTPPSPPLNPEGNSIEAPDGKNEIVSPPMPPTPPEPVDHVIALAKKGATFYYEGKKISSDRAIELIKKNKSLNIQTTKHDSDNPQVKISKEPIIIKRQSNSKEKATSGWTVTSAANRKTIAKDSFPTPPPAPAIALHEKQDHYSKKLLELISAYVKKNVEYEDLVDRYLKKQEGSAQNLWNVYNETIELYVAYYNQAKEEGNFVHPIPDYKIRK